MSHTLIEAPQLQLLNLEGFVSKLNGLLHKNEKPVELDAFIPMEPRKNPFKWIEHMVNDTETIALGKYSLYQSGVGVLSGILGMDSETSAGYILIETGDTNASSETGGIYETMKLRIKRRLDLRSGSVLPKLTIKIHAEAEDMTTPQVFPRRDHIRRRMQWQITDLSSLIPTEYFLQPTVAESYREVA